MSVYLAQIRPVKLDVEVVSPFFRCIISSLIVELLNRAFIRHYACGHISAKY